jgi:hypothetical protein
LFEGQEQMGQDKMEHDRPRWRRACPVLVALTLAAGGISAASAQMPGYNGYNQSQRVWNRMDACKRQAWKQHPDYTHADSLKRDEAVRRCLASNNAPPVAPLTPPPPQQPSGSSRSR